MKKVIVNWFATEMARVLQACVPVRGTTGHTHPIRTVPAGLVIAACMTATAPATSLWVGSTSLVGPTVACAQEVIVGDLDPCFANCHHFAMWGMEALGWSLEFASGGFEWCMNENCGGMYT